MLVSFSSTSDPLLNHSDIFRDCRKPRKDNSKCLTVLYCCRIVGPGDRRLRQLDRTFHQTRLNSNIIAPRDREPDDSRCFRNRYPLGSRPLRSSRPHENGIRDRLPGRNRRIVIQGGHRVPGDPDLICRIPGLGPGDRGQHQIEYRQSQAS